MFASVPANFNDGLPNSVSPCHVKAVRALTKHAGHLTRLDCPLHVLVTNPTADRLEKSRFMPKDATSCFCKTSQ